MKTKLCRKCHIVKPEEDFYTRGQNADGMSSYCRLCTRKTTLDWRAKNPGKRKAHQAVATALRNGIIKRPCFCEKCGRKTMLVAHHHNYKKPLDIVWVCDACHFKIHQKDGQKKGVYRGANYKDF